MLDVTEPLNQNTFVLTFSVCTALALSEGCGVFLRSKGSKMDSNSEMEIYYLKLEF